jgi:predicted RNA-binding Zn-ribbon protein involved in translation (DUF1610 family)
VTTRLCDSCGAKQGSHTRFGVFLCPACLESLEETERQRQEDERAKVQEVAKSSPLPAQPSLALMLYFKQIKLGSILPISPEKIPDYCNTNLNPLMHLLSDEELTSLVPIMKEVYFAVHAALGMRKVDRFREAEIIKKSQKQGKTRSKAESEITRQKKHASKDKTLSKEERAKAKIIEGLVAMGISEADAKRMAEIKK